MMRIVFLFLLALSVYGQTHLDLDQLGIGVGPGLTITSVNGRKQLELEPSYIESISESALSDSRCPAPILTTVNQKEVRVGNTWSTSNPCYLHFLVQPPFSPDPLSVVRWEEGFVFTIHPDFVGDTRLLVYANPPTPTIPARLIVSGFNSVVFDHANSPCEQENRCTLIDVPQQAGDSPQMFPPNAIPLGVVEVFGGQAQPHPYGIADRHQIQSPAPIDVMTSDGNYLFLLGNTDTATARLERAEELLQASINKSQAAILQRAARVDSEPPTAQQVIALMKDVQELRQQLDHLEWILDKSETLAQLAALKELVEQGVQDARYLTEEVQNIREEAYREVYNQAYGAESALRVAVPMDLRALCHPGTFAVSDYMYYRCLADAHWGVQPLIRPVPPAPVEEEPVPLRLASTDGGN